MSVSAAQLAESRQHFFEAVDALEQAYPIAQPSGQGNPTPAAVGPAEVL